jgi:hypothetical protein
MGVAGKAEIEMNAQRGNWHALHQVQEFRAAGQAAIMAEWHAAGNPNIDSTWMTRSMWVTSQPMAESVILHGHPPRLDELAEAKRQGRLQELIDEANAKFAASKALQ